MKKLYLFILPLILLSLGSCSSEEDDFIDPYHLTGTRWIMTVSYGEDLEETMLIFNSNGTGTDILTSFEYEYDEIKDKENYITYTDTVEFVWRWVSEDKIEMTYGHNDVVFFYVRKLTGSSLAGIWDNMEVDFKTASCG